MWVTPWGRVDEAGGNEAIGVETRTVQEPDAAGGLQWTWRSGLSFSKVDRSRRRLPGLWERVQIAPWGVSDLPAHRWPRWPRVGGTGLDEVHSSGASVVPRAHRAALGPLPGDWWAMRSNHRAHSGGLLRCCMNQSPLGAVAHKNENQCPSQWTRRRVGSIALGSWPLVPRRHCGVSSLAIPAVVYWGSGGVYWYCPPHWWRMQLYTPRTDVYTFRVDVEPSFVTCGDAQAFVFLCSSRVWSRDSSFPWVRP
ncbi:hypothetical protein N7532_008465 [Penicillium argentinense]|uniref:Uncharacterized protein n=1 Tax=Penicillium argentinense TaxID=1131581 RepID=A0A9W9EXN1_9EURO|nr:uncharacterized protein N7532_008465 [Penicillium argentinense]KAJ5089781.1 hypothetical protein N7532_008465 [Penicillium argentinense]